MIIFSSVFHGHLIVVFLLLLYGCFYIALFDVNMGIVPIILSKVSWPIVFCMATETWLFLINNYFFYYVLTNYILHGTLATTFMRVLHLYILEPLSIPYFIWLIKIYFMLRLSPLLFYLYYFIIAIINYVVLRRSFSRS